MPNFDPTAEQLAWELTCSTAITSDVLWKLDAYRTALFLLHDSRNDCRVVRTARPGTVVEDQLTRAAASIGANLSEGYGRSTRNDRLRFHGYALGSTRECIVWYLAASDALPEEVLENRLQRLARIRSLVLGLIRSVRKGGTNISP